MKKRDPLGVCVTQSMQQYFQDLNGQSPQNLHGFFIAEVERPFLEVVMDHVQGNQTHAAEILGINRNTLRKKLQTYGLN